LNTGRDLGAGKERCHQDFSMTIPTAKGKRFSVGKYDIIASPISYSAHMLRYTVFVDGRRIGATASLPSESDCRFLEHPPYVPPLVPWSPIYRPGRPKKGAPPRTNEAAAAPREELPHDIALPRSTDER
jgi:hypothetical protein